MDIIIRNGVIQREEAKKLKEIKNKAGLLKKNFNESFSKDIPGPYYDLLDSHLCVPRWWNQIPNFMGPQIKNRLKLKENSNFNKKCKYCYICHSIITPNLSFSGKRKVLCYEDIFERKQDITDQLEKSFKKIKINNEEDNADIILENFNKINIKSINEKWNNLYLKLNKKIKLDTHTNYKKTEKDIIYKYYKLVYKLIKQPILYPINSMENKLIWPWNLTNYQKLKLNDPNYKNSNMFFNKNINMVDTKYIMID
tara:strand:+ start:8701 stop:9462 length:762 start_codon:yes stop_codon:yes gene_type:complete